MKTELELASPRDASGQELHKIVLDFQCSLMWVKVLWYVRIPEQKIIIFKKNQSDNVI